MLYGAIFVLHMHVIIVEIVVSRCAKKAFVRIVVP